MIVPAEGGAASVLAEIPPTALGGSWSDDGSIVVGSSVGLRVPPSGGEPERPYSAVAGAFQRANSEGELGNPVSASLWAITVRNQRFATRPAASNDDTTSAHTTSSSPAVSCTSR
jgi:hypothetical protein